MMSDNGHSTETNSGISVENHISGYPVGHYYLAHGGGGNTGKWIGHKGDFLEGRIRVPAIISYPGQFPAGQTRDQVVTVMDVFPTVLEFCGIEPAAAAPRLDGHSLLDVIADKDAPGGHEVLHFGWAGRWAIRKNEWKLICDKPNNLSLGRLTVAEPEARDYAMEFPETVAELTRLHHEWAREVNSD